MANPNTLIFIPDISGFTTFLNETEVMHAKHIISELLETIDSKNSLDLELAEIEGDALFYFKKKKIPSPEKILQMTRDMFVGFHYQLQYYEKRRICQCGACSTATNLTLKFIVHEGDTEIIRVGTTTKPFGTDVVLAHRLLKNTIQGHEYILMTDSLARKLKKIPPDLVFRSVNEQNRDLGEISYVFADIHHFRDEVHPLADIPKGLQTSNPVIIEGFIDKEIREVYELISNLDHRLKWNKKTERLDYAEDKVNRVGQKHLCVIDGKEIVFETITSHFDDDTMVFGEATSDIPIVKSATNYFILKPLGEKTLLRIESHVQPLPVIGVLLSPLFKKMIRRQMQDALNMIREITAPTRLQSA